MINKRQFSGFNSRWGLAGTTAEGEAHNLFSEKLSDTYSCFTHWGKSAGISVRALLLQSTIDPKQLHCVGHPAPAVWPVENRKPVCTTKAAYAYNNTAAMLVGAGSPRCGRLRKNCLSFRLLRPLIAVKFLSCTL